MAGLLCAVTTPEIVLVANTLKTVLQLMTGSNQRTKLKKWGIFFDGISPSAEPIQVRLLRQTTAIGGTPTAVTPMVLVAGVAETPRASAAYSAGGTEPTAGDVLDVKQIHPQSGYEYSFLLGDELLLTNDAGRSRVGIDCLVPVGGATVNCRTVMWFDE